MLSANRIAWGAGLLLAVVATLSSVSNATTVSATFSGTVAHEGVSAPSFTIPHDGAVEVTLTGLGPRPSRRLGSDSARRPSRGTARSSKRATERT